MSEPRGSRAPSPQQPSTLPAARVKRLAKVDPEINAKLREETVRTIAKATELFVEHLAHEAFKHARQNKRNSKTLGYQDVCLAIGGSPTFGFLQDVIAPQPSQSKRQNTGSG